MAKIDQRLFLNASLREEYLEYVFLGSLCQTAWKRDEELEILRCQTDAQGYDLILEARGFQRHVQLKSSYIGSRTASQNTQRQTAKV